MARRLRGLVSLPLFVAVLGGGCATRESRGTDSNTNWLKPCLQDNECGGLTCLCGQCSRTCGANADCTSLPGGVCRPNVEHPSACGADPSSGACAVECGSDRDCAALGLTCVLGFCEDSTVAGDSGLSGASGGPGNQGGGGAAAGTGVGGKGGVGGAPTGPGGGGPAGATGPGGGGPTGAAGSSALGAGAGSSAFGGGAGFGGPNPGGGPAGGRGGVAGAAADAGALPPLGGGAGTAGAPPPGATFSVAADGYVSSGTWMGYAWTATDGKSATIISPAEAAGGSLCASGTVAGTADSTAVAILGLNLNQASADAGGSSGSPRLTWSPSGGGIVYSVSNTFGSTLRIQIQAAGGDTDPSKRWCSPITSSSGVIPWSTFNTACWDGSGTNYDGTTPLQSAMVVVPGYPTAVPFNFCLNSMGPS